MRGISEKRLRAILHNQILTPKTQSFIQYLLEDECKELNPWLPIDENTPKTRKVLLFYASDKQQVIGWVTAHPQATHYQELPEAPQGYTGRQEVARMTGLQETTIRDILILNGEIT